MKRILYHPVINAALRTVARPFAPVIPEQFKFPVTGVIKVKVAAGKHIRVKCNPTSFVARKLFWHGMDGFEYTMARLFTRLVEDTEVFLDIGANIGYYSLLASALKPQMKVISFEPAPAVFAYLKDNQELNGFDHMKPEQLAMSDQDGHLEFFISKNPKYVGIADHHLTSTGSFDKVQADRTSILESVKVQTTTLDNYVQKQKLDKIDLIKLDTEATEHLVLAGAQHVLKNHRPVFFCEVLPGKVEQKIAEAFSAHNYLIYRLANTGIERVDLLSHDASITNDHLMIPPEKQDYLESLLEN